MAITQTDIWNVFGSDISKLTDSDRLLVKAADGSNAVLILVSQARAYLTAQIQPSISSDGNWYIGGTNVNVKAKGETPHLGADDSGIYYYLDSETVSGTITKHVILPRNDFYVNLSTLTDEQYNALVTNVVNTFNTKLETEIVSAVNAANNAAASANTQSERAKGYADHPNIIGNDNYWYAWDETTSSYIKTEKYAIGGFLLDMNLNPQNGQLICNYSESLGDFTYDNLNGKLTYTY